MLRHRSLVSRARPLLLSTLSRQVPARVVHRRLLCSEPKKPSGAFDAFFPKKGKPKKGHEKKASGSASGEASESSKAAGESSSSSSDPANAARAFFGGGGSGDGPPQWQRGLLAGAMAGAVLFFSMNTSDGRPMQEISMQHFISNLLAQRRVAKLLVVNGTTVRVVVVDAAEDDALMASGGTGDGSSSSSRSGSQGDGQPSYYFTIGSIDQFEEKLEATQAALGVPLREYVPVQFVTQPSLAAEAGRFLPTLLLIGFFYMLSRGMAGGLGGGAGGPGGMFNVGKSKAVRATKVQTRFKDVAGLNEAKVEIMEFVDILQNPERYTKLGAKIPKGALLVGPPGCGKTLLAKATAGEAKAPFFSISGSDFIEMFVGVGPSRVRDLFAQARANAPCLVFIDEIDAVGRARGRGGFGGGNDERENTLNQLLIEMDGFSSSAGVVILAGTNRADILDQALLRPGRFDRQVEIGKPDIDGRREIFLVHLGPLKLKGEADATARRLSALTPGFSGAEVANVCNEAALIAARRQLAEIDEDCFDAAIDRVIAGLEKKGLTIDQHERRVVAYHEAGHALTGWMLDGADPVMKVSIVPRGKAALGYSQSLPRDVALHTEEQLADTMVMALGGRAAEEVVFDVVSSGAQNDLERVTKMAYSQVTDFGFSQSVGPLSFAKDGDNTLYKPFSEATARMIDREAEAMVSKNYDRALKLLREHRAKLNALAECLLENEVVNSDDLVRILGPRKEPLPGQLPTPEYGVGVVEPDPA